MVSLDCAQNVFFMNVHLENYQNGAEEVLAKQSRQRACWKIQKRYWSAGCLSQENSYKLREILSSFFFS